MRDGLAGRPLVIRPHDVPGATGYRFSSASGRARASSRTRACGTADPSGSASTAAADRSMRASKPRFCSSLPTSSHSLIRMMPPSTINCSISGQRSRKRSPSANKIPSRVSTPARLYQLRWKSRPRRRRKVLHVALHVHLALLAVRRRRQGHDAEDARADLFGERANRAAFAGAVAAFEHDDDPQAFLLDPALQVTELAPAACRSPSRNSFASSLGPRYRRGESKPAGYYAPRRCSRGRVSR